MKVSVVIPNYNGRSLLENCIESLLLQTYKDFEIIVVDNGSTDDSYELIIRQFPQIKFISLGANYGFSKAVNEGIKSANGEYIVLLNNDVECTNDWLENLVKCIEQDEKIFSVSSKLLQYYTRDKIDDAGDELNLLGIAFQQGNNLSNKSYTRRRSIFSSCAGAAIYRKKLFNVIGYFDENFFAYLEDVDIGFRAKIYGYKNIYCPNAIVYHMSGATSSNMSNHFKIRLSARNSVYLFYKNMPPLQLLINTPFLLLGLLIKLGFSIYKKTSGPYLRGIKEGLSNVKTIQRINFKKENLLNYIRIQIVLLYNIIIFILFRLKRIFV